jgi:hypothetical protein
MCLINKQSVGWQDVLDYQAFWSMARCACVSSGVVDDSVCLSNKPSGRWQYELE